jgi:hydrogenase expression/formation protein HypC
MCLAVPARVVELLDNEAVVDVRGNRMQADVSLLDDVRLGDYVLVHAGFAISKYDPVEARKTLAVYDEYFAQMHRDHDDPNVPDK